MRKLNLYYKSQFTPNGVCEKCTHRMVCATSKVPAIPMEHLSDFEEGKVKYEKYQVECPKCLFHKKYTPIMLGRDSIFFKVQNFKIKNNLIEVVIPASRSSVAGEIVKNDGSEKRAIVLFILVYTLFCIGINLLSYNWLLPLALILVLGSKKIWKKRTKEWEAANAELEEMRDEIP